MRLRVRGHSMRPLLPDGSTVELAPLCGAPRVGDVVAAELGERFVVHRVLETGPPIVLKGDWNRAADRPAPHAAIIARVVRLWTPGGWSARWDTPAARRLGWIMAWVSRARMRRKGPIS